MTDDDALVFDGPGAVVSIPYGPVAEWLVEAGFTWIVIDAEHAPIGPTEQVSLITAVHAAGARAFVRVADDHARSIGFALDAGADGVIVPDVRTADDARAAAAACRYPPDGTRSIGPTRRQAATPVCVAQIETVAAVGAADQIAATGGVDALMMGPGDLALDTGLLPGLDSHHATMVDHYHRVRTAGAAAGIPTGTFALTGADDVDRATAFGWDFIASCLDRVALTSAAREVHGRARADRPAREAGVAPDDAPRT